MGSIEKEQAECAGRLQNSQCNQSFRTADCAALDVSKRPEDLSEHHLQAISHCSILEEISWLDGACMAALAAVPQVADTISLCRGVESRL